MPAVSQDQQQFFGAELRRRRAGKKTRSGAKTEDIEDFASTKHAGLPVKKRPTGSGPFTDKELARGYRST